MTSFKKNDIHLAEIAFTDGTATKKRPVVIVSGKQEARPIGQRRLPENRGMYQT